MNRVAIVLAAGLAAHLAFSAYWYIERPAPKWLFVACADPVQDASFEKVKEWQRIAAFWHANVREGGRPKPSTGVDGFIAVEDAAKTLGFGKTHIHNWMGKVATDTGEPASAEQVGKVVADKGRPGKNANRSWHFS